MAAAQAAADAGSVDGAQQLQLQPPVLASIMLRNCSLEGQLPASWAQLPALLQLAGLDLSRQDGQARPRPTPTLPAHCGLGAALPVPGRKQPGQGTHPPHLHLPFVCRNRLTGTLPLSWLGSMKEAVHKDWPLAGFTPRLSLWGNRLSGRLELGPEQEVGGREGGQAGGGWRW